MNRQQKILVVNFVTVVFVTAVFVVGMMHVKDWLNKSEAIRAMEHIGELVLQYRQKYGSLPAESYLAPVKAKFVRLGELHYRAQWIDFDSPADTILAYTKKELRSELVKSGYVVLRLDGQVQWMEKRQFEQLLRQQQTEREIEMLQKRIDKSF
jgi:hypothetical protein